MKWLANFREIIRRLVLVSKLRRSSSIVILPFPEFSRGLSGIWESLLVPKLLEQARDAIRIRLQHQNRRVLPQMDETLHPIPQ